MKMMFKDNTLLFPEETSITKCLQHVIKQKSKDELTEKEIEEKLVNNALYVTSKRSIFKLTFYMTATKTEHGISIDIYHVAPVEDDTPQLVVNQEP